jgi:hypothetical protein
MLKSVAAASYRLKASWEASEVWQRKRLPKLDRDGESQWTVAEANFAICTATTEACKKKVMVKKFGQVSWTDSTTA